MPAKNASASWYSACWILRLILAASVTEPATAVSIAAGGHLLRTGVQVSGANLGGLGLFLHEFTGCFRNFQVLKLGKCLGDGREGFLDAIKYGIGLSGHFEFSILSV